jgi:Radical SAM superfamily
MDDPVQRVHEQIDRELPRRHSNRVLHSHPSPNLWLERDVPVAELLDQRGAEPHAGGAICAKRLLVYVGSPYCLPTNPDRCGFCLFPSEVYKGPEQLVTYLRYLTREGELVSGWFDDREMSALYFGGGTTNLYHPRQYGELMDLVRRVCPRATGDVEVTIEGVAQLFTRAKLDAMQEAGVTRVSMGVQQLDPRPSEAQWPEAECRPRPRDDRVLPHHRAREQRRSDLQLARPDSRQTVDYILRDLGTLVEARVPLVGGDKFILDSAHHLAEAPLESGPGSAESGMVPPWVSHSNLRLGACRPISGVDCSGGTKGHSLRRRTLARGERLCQGHRLLRQPCAKRFRIGPDGDRCNRKR